MFSIKELKKYYKGKELVDKIIEQRLKEDKDLTLYGGRAANMQLPKYLQRETEDWDIYSEDNPEQDARELETLLDKRFGMDFFSVVPSRHEGTYIVRSKVTGQGVADITLKRTDVLHRKVAGIDVTTLEYQVKRMKATLKDPARKHRWDKDRDTLQRITIFATDQKKTPGKRPSLTVEVEPISKAGLFGKHPNQTNLRGVNVPKRGRIMAGVAFTDRGKQRLSRRHHRGWKRIKFT